MNNQYHFVKSEVTHELATLKKSKTTWELVNSHGWFTQWLIRIEDEGLHSIYHDEKCVAEFITLDDAKVRLLHLASKN